MNVKPIYMPVLKWKQGEQGALKELPDEIKNKITPLIEITPDFNEDKLDYTLKSWENRKFYFDVMPECYEVDNDIYFRILERLDPNLVIPVLSLQDDLKIIKTASKLSNNGFALRITTNDIDNIESSLECLLTNFEGKNIALILDMKSITSETFKEKFTVLKSMISDIHNINNYRNVILSCSSFPKTLSSVEKYDVSFIDRLDWKFWLMCIERLNEKNGIKLVYSDYCIDNPKYVDYIPGMSPSFSIRYTCKDYFLVLKGDTVKKGGLDGENISKLCKKLISLEDFCGAEYSWGDNYIAVRATEDADSYGNLTTWRKVGTNHHITFVIDQISNLF